MAQEPTRKKDQGNLYTILGLAAGAAIGAGVALVYSPGKGEQNRKRLQGWVQSRAGDARSQARSRASELQNKAQQAASQGADWATNRVTDARDKVQEVASSAAATAQSVVDKDTDNLPAQVQDMAAQTPKEMPEGTILIVPEDKATES